MSAARLHLPRADELTNAQKAELRELHAVYRDRRAHADTVVLSTKAIVKAASDLAAAENRHVDEAWSAFGAKAIELGVSVSESIDIIFPEGQP